MYIYGKNVAREHINSGNKIDRAYLSLNFKDKEIVDLLKEKKVRIEYVKNNILDSKVNGLHQGIVLKVDDTKTYSYDEIIRNIGKEYPLVVMLDHIEDPHNFGAIIRTCEALGVDAIIIPSDRSVSVNSTVIKTAVGAQEYIPIIKVSNLYSTIEKLKKDGYWIIGTDMEGEDYNKIDYKMPICLVIGNEGKGMSKIVKDNCDFIASIPMTGKINSLNASVSCAIIVAKIVSSR